MKSIPLLAVSIILYQQVFAQNSSTLMGAKANGLGYASSCIMDEWAVFNNPGGLSKTDQLTAAFSYDARPQFQSFNRMATVVAIPLTAGSAGIGVFKFGDDLYNEQIISAAYSNQFGLASLGAKVNYVQYSIEGFGRKGKVSLSFGGIATLTPQLSVGAHIININQPEISEGEKLPTLLVAGIAYKPTDKVFVTAEVEKNLDYQPVVKGGLEYEVNKKFIARTGFNAKPNAAFMGLGFRPKTFALDYAYSYHPENGSRHQATVAYRFNRKSKPKD